MNESNVSGSAKLLGVLMIILGILALATPLLAGKSVLMFIGILIAAAGAIRMFWALRAESPGGGIWKFLLGVLTLLAGGAVLAHPMMASGVLTIIMAMYLFADGLIEVIVAFTLEGKPGRGWLFFGGLMSVLLACLLFFQFPVSGVLALGLFLGIKLIFVGMTTVALGTSLHTVMKQ